MNNAVTIFNNVVTRPLVLLLVLDLFLPGPRRLLALVLVLGRCQLMLGLLLDLRLPLMCPPYPLGLRIPALSPPLGLRLPSLGLCLPVMGPQFGCLGIREDATLPHMTTANNTQD
ncbi:hypothetical protein BDD12DRAFT_833071, partial [Trichophaea hybrida]